MTEYRENLIGLVMAGGESKRMGWNKAELVYQNREQYRVVYDLLQVYCSEVFISCKADHNYTLPAIIDDKKFAQCGPVAGLIAAYKQKAKPVFALGIDYPLLQAEDIRFILESRDLNKEATVYFNSESGFFEPLIAIYETSFLSTLESQAEAFGYSLQKMLQQAAVKKVSAEHSSHFRSIDTPEAYNSIKKQMK